MKTTVRTLLSTLLLGAASFSVADTHPVSSDDVEAVNNEAQAFAERAELAADSIVTSLMEEHKVPGLTLAIVKDGDVAVLKGYGYANLDTQELVDPTRHLFRVGSTSKTFVWTAVMQLVEQGKLDLNANLNTYLKSFQLPEPFGKSLTMNDLMAHRTGIEEWGVGMFVTDPAGVMPLNEFLEKYMPQQVREPGGAVAYSNYGVALAGLVIQEITGQPFNDYVTEQLFQPLGMTSTTFLEPIGEHPTEESMSPELTANIAQSYSGAASDVHKPFQIKFVHSMGPAGSGFSTAADMANYMIAHLNKGELNGQRVIKASTIDQMRERNFDDRLAMDDFAHGFFNGKTNGYEYFGHGGATATYRTVMDFYPELGFGVYATISQAEGTAAIGKLPSMLVERLFPPKEPVVRPVPSKAFVEQAAKYAGTYEGNRRAYTNMERMYGLFGSDTTVSVSPQGHLLVSGSQGTEAFVEVAPLTFQQLNGSKHIMFEEDANGNVVRFSAALGHNSYEKIGYFSTRAFFILALVLTLLFAFGTFLGAWRRRIAPDAVKVLASRTSFYAACGVALWLVSAIAAVIQLSAGSGWFPQPLVVLFAWVSLLLVALFVGVVIGVPSAWAASGWSWKRKFHHIGFAVVGILMAIALWQWNLLPFFV